MLFTFSLLGRTLEAHALPPRLKGWLESFWHYPEHDAPPHPFRIILTHSPDLPADVQLEGLAVTELELHAVPFSLPSRPLPGTNCWLLGDEHEGLRLTLDEQKARLELWGEGRTLLPHALFIALGESLRWSGLVPLHASVIAKEGRATAFLGRSGQGKTTTLLRSVLAGWQPIAEDFVWLEPQTMLLYGWDRGIRLLPDTLTWLGSHLGDEDFLASARVVEDKAFFPYDVLAQKFGYDAQGRRAVLERLAVLERDPTLPSQWQPLPKREAALALWEAVGLPLSEGARKTMSAAIPQILSRSRCERLILDRETLPL